MTQKRPDLGPYVPGLVKTGVSHLVVFILILNLACSYSAPVTNDVATLDYSEGCFYMMQHYEEGERIITNEPCLNCTCQNSMLMCFLKVCPFAKPIGQNCTVEKRPNQCCPVITCPEVPVPLMIGVVSTTTRPVTPSSFTGLATLSDEEGCVIDDKYYPDGAQVPSDPSKPCDLCYCIRNHTACVMQECILYVDGCAPIFEEGVCCPVRYECDRDKIPQVIGTTQPPAIANSDMCFRNGEAYVDGALVPTEDPCEHCYCMHGDIVCAVQECGKPMQPLGDNCVAIAPKEGQCCPEAYECYTTSTEVEIIPSNGQQQVMESGDSEGSDFQSTERPAEDKIEESSEDTSTDDTVLEVVSPTSEQQLFETSDNKAPESLEELLTTESEAVTSHEATRPPVFEATVVETEEGLSLTSAPPVESLPQETTSEEDTESGTTFPSSDSELAGEEDQSATVLPETSESQPESIPDDAVIFPGPPSQESEFPEDIASSLNSQKPLQGGNSMIVNLDELVGKDDVTSEDQGSHQVIASSLGESTPGTTENGSTAEIEEETPVAQLVEESAQESSNLSEGEDQDNLTNGLATESSIPEDIFDLGNKNEVQSTLETDSSVAGKEESATEAQDEGSGASLVEQAGEKDTGSGEGSLMPELVGASVEFSGEESVTESSLNLDYNVENEQSNEKDNDLMPIQPTEDHSATEMNENPVTDLMIESGSGSLSSEHELGATETSDGLSDKIDTITESNNQLLEQTTETLNPMEINPTPVQIIDSGSGMDQIKETSGEVLDGIGNSDTIKEEDLLEIEGSGNIPAEEILTDKEPESTEGSGEQLEVEDLGSVDKTEEIQSQTEVLTINSTQQNALTVSGDGEEISINNEGSGEQLEAEDPYAGNKNDAGQSQTESPTTQFIEENSSKEIDEGSGIAGETSTDEVGSGEQLEAENLDSVDTNDEVENQPGVTTSQSIDHNSLTDMDEGSGNLEGTSANEEGSREQSGAENPGSGEKNDEYQSQTEAPIEQSTEKNSSTDIDEGSGTLEEISTSDNTIKEQNINDQGSGIFLEMLDLTNEKEPESQSVSGDNASLFEAEETSRPNNLLEEGSSLVMVEGSGNDGQTGDESPVPSIIPEIEDEVSGNNELNSKEDTDEANSIASEVTTVNSIQTDDLGNAEGTEINLDSMLTVTETSESETIIHLTEKGPEKEVMETEKESDHGSENAEQLGNVESETSEKLDALDESTDDPIFIGDNNIPSITEFTTSMIDLSQESNESNIDLGSGENLEKEDNENNEDVANLLEVTFEPEILVTSAKPEMVLINTNEPENILEAQATVVPIQEGAEDIESSGEGLVNESSNGLGSGEKLDNEEIANNVAVTDILEIGTEPEVSVTSAKPEMVQVNTNEPGNPLGTQSSIVSIEEGAEEVESSGEELVNEDTDGLGSGENLEQEENENNVAVTDVLEMATEQQIIVTSAKPEMVQINTNKPGSLLGTQSPIIPIQEGAGDADSFGEALIDEETDAQIDKEDTTPFSTISEGTKEDDSESSGSLLTEDPTQNPEISQGSETESSTEKLEESGFELPVGSIEQSSHSEIGNDLEGLEEMEFSGHSTVTPDNSHSIDSEGSGDNSLPLTQENLSIEGSGSFETELDAGNTEIESPESGDGDALLSNGEEEENQDSSQTEAESTDSSSIEEATLNPMSQVISSQTSESSSTIEEGGPKDESELEVVDASIQTATEKAEIDNPQTTESVQEGSLDQTGNEVNDIMMEATTEKGETIEKESTENILAGSEDDNGNTIVDAETQSATEKGESYGQETTENGQEVIVNEAVDTAIQAATEKDEISGQDSTESLPSITNDQLSASGPEESNINGEDLNLESSTDNINVVSEITEDPDNAEVFNTEKPNVVEDDKNTVSLGLEITTDFSQISSGEGSGILPINPDEETIANEIDSSEISTGVPLGSMPDISVDENIGSDSQVLEEGIEIFEPMATDSPSEEVQNETTVSAEADENTSEVSGSSESLEELLSTDKRPDLQSEEVTKPPIFEATVVETESDILSTSSPLFETTSNGEMFTEISLIEEADDKVDAAVEEIDTTDNALSENLESSTDLTADKVESSLHEVTTRRIDENAGDTGDFAPVPSNTDRPDDSDVAEATAMSVEETFVDDTEETLAEQSLNEDKDQSEITENLSNISATESSNLITESETSPQDGFILDYDADSTEITPNASTESDLEDNSGLNEVTTRASNDLPESTSPSFIGETLSEAGATGSPEEGSLDNSTESDGDDSENTEKPAEDKVEESSENTSTSNAMPEDVSPAGEQQISETSDNKTPESLEELLTIDNEDVAPHEEATKPPIFEATVIEAEVDMSSTSAPLVETLPQEVPGEGNCFVEGITYPNGGFVRSSSSCMINCICKNSIVTCSVPNCPSPPESLNCSPVERSGDCCPQYACPGSCFVEGEVYENFSPVPTNDSCRSCFCINSQLECITPVCSRPPELGCRLVKVNVPGECCPSWKCLQEGESGSVFPPSESQLAGEEDQSAAVLPETTESQSEGKPDDAVIFPGPPSQESEIPEDIASTLNSQKPLQEGNSVIVNLDELVGKDDVTSEDQGSHQVIGSSLGVSTVAPQSIAENNNNRPVTLEEKIDEEVMDEETNQGNENGIQEVADEDTGLNENEESDKDNNGSNKGEDTKIEDGQNTTESLEPIKEANAENLATDSELESVPNSENEIPENIDVEDNSVDNKEMITDSINSPEETSENEGKPGEEGDVNLEGESMSDIGAQETTSAEEQQVGSNLETQNVEGTESDNKPSQGEEGKDDEVFQTEAENEIETENSGPDNETPGQSGSQENAQTDKNDQGNGEIQSIEGESEVSESSEEEGNFPQAPELGVAKPSENNKDEIGAESEGEQAENEEDTNKVDPDSKDTLPQDEIVQRPAEENLVLDNEQGPNKGTEVEENADDKDEEASSDNQSFNAEGPSLSGEEAQTIVEPLPETEDTEIQTIEELDSSDLTPAVGTAEVSLLEELDSDSREPEEIDEESEFDEEESPDLVIGPGACLFDGKVFVSAQQIPRDDPCDFCFCFRGDIICLQQSCPPPIPGCFEEAIGGFCCPRYECPVRQAFQNITVQPTIPPLPVLMRNPQPIALPLTQVEVQGCEILGEFFQQGEIIPRASGPCLECKCGMNGMMECDPRACQPEPMLRKMMTAAVKRRRRSLGKRLGREIHFYISGDRLIME